MNIYARIRKIEEPDLFKRFFNCLMGAEDHKDFEDIKEHADYGIDGYSKKSKTVYAVYCPKYPERKTQGQYKTKIKSDLEKLKANFDQKNITIPIQKWCFVTPDDLSSEIKNYINEQVQQYGWEWETLTAQTLAPLFMKHEQIHFDFPEIAAGFQYDKMPSLYIKFVNNRNFPAIEVFNNGTESLQDLEFETSDNETNWQQRNEQFLYDFDNPTMASPHSCHTLKKGERQYIVNVPRYGNFHYRLSARGVESQKTITQKGFIENRNP